MQAHRHRVGISQEGEVASFLGVPDPGEEGTLEHQALALTLAPLSRAASSGAAGETQCHGRAQDSEKPNEMMGFGRVWGGTMLSGQRTVWGHLSCSIVPTCVLRSLPLFLHPGWATMSSNWTPW